jgi:hypothetical protein
MSQRRACVLVYDTLWATAEDRLLIAKLEGRGLDVHLVVAPANRDTQQWASTIRSRIEGLVSPRPAVSLRSLARTPVRQASSAESVPAIVSSLEPSFVIHFADRDTAERIAGTSQVDVYQVWLDGRPESLRMASAAVPADGSRALVVSRFRTGAARARVVERADVVPQRAWVSADQVSAATRAVALFLRALDRSAEAGEGEGEGEGEVEAAGTAGSLRTLGESARVFGNALLRRVSRKWLRDDAWFLAYGSGGPRRFLSGGADGFFADPCAVTHEGTVFVFCESFDYRLGRGVIAVSRWKNDVLDRPETVLQRPYHLSYPFVFEHDGAWWMVPETYDNRKVELYRAADFPHSWVLDTTLLEDVSAADATLHHDGRRWWMFVSIGEHGSSTWDELFVFVADELRGPWRPHARNPVKKSFGSARPAGRLFRRGEELVRPAQDCSRIYGGGIRFCVVDTLTETEYAEHEAELISPALVPGAEALHTISKAGAFEVYDARLPRAWLNEKRFHAQLDAARRRHV